MDVATDKSWRWSATKVDGWQKPEFAASDWQPAVELGKVDIAPWNLGAKFAAVMSGASLRGQVRAGLVNSDPLMTALGRPNREQVITTRASAATTLQGLEMTNGSTLAELLKRGAEEVAGRWPKPARELIVELYQRALGRQPTGDELRLAQEMVGSPLKKEGVEDLLWAMTMLPEFQLIY
jgi:hypothetical protein